MAHPERTRFEALQLYIAGHSLDAIAEKTGVSIATLKRWKREPDLDKLTWDDHRLKKRAEALARMEVGLSEDLEGEISHTREMLEELRRIAKDGIGDIPKSQTLYAYMKLQERLLTLLGEMPGAAGKHLLIVGSADAAIFCNWLIELIEKDPELGPAWKRRGEAIKDELRKNLKALACHRNAQKALSP